MSQTAINQLSPDPRNYERLLHLMHVTQGDVLARMVQQCGIEAGAKVLDVGSGDGFFAEQLSQFVGSRGQVVGVDLDEQFLAQARQRCSKLPGPCSFVRGNAEALPFPDSHFDVSFCALSFFDFARPLRVLQQMKRVTKPGGLVVVIEHDSNHQALFPYPSAVELAIDQAVKSASSEQPGMSARFYSARHLPEWMAGEGLVDVRRQSYSKDFSHPLSAAELGYVDAFFDELMRLTDPFLDDEARLTFQAYREGSSPRPAPDSPGFSATFFHFVTSGRIPAVS